MNDFELQEIAARLEQESRLPRASHAMRKRMLAVSLAAFDARENRRRTLCGLAAVVGLLLAGIGLGVLQARYAPMRPVLTQATRLTESATMAPLVMEPSGGLALGTSHLEAALLARERTFRRLLREF